MFQGQFPAIKPITVFLWLKSCNLAIWQDANMLSSRNGLLFVQRGLQNPRLPQHYSALIQAFALQAAMTISMSHI